MQTSSNKLKMNFVWSFEDKMLYGDMYGKYLLTGAVFYKNPSMVEGISKAVVQCDLSKVKKLVEIGEDINIFDDYGNGPIYIAAVKNNSSVLCYLLSIDNSFINHRNFLGETPLLRAVTDHRFEIAELLICGGADVNIANNSKITPLHLAVQNPRMTQILIEKGANIDAVDMFQQTPLHYAVDCNCLETVNMLLYYNADVSISNQHNYTPFMLALERRNVEIQKALFEYVADYEHVTATKCNFSMLGLAIFYESPLTEEMILRGADVNNVNRHTNGAFYLALHFTSIKGNVNLNTFKMIWERIDYEPVEHIRISALGSISYIEKEVFHGIVDIFMDSDKFSLITESVCAANDLSSFIVKCIENNLPLEKFTKLFCMLLCHGYTPNESDLLIIFNYWGYCEIFRILLYMDIGVCIFSPTLDKIPTRLIHEVKINVNELLHMLVTIIKGGTYLVDTLLTVAVFRVLDYCVYPPLFDIYLKMKKNDCVSLKMRALSKVPSLLELARNQTREHIKKSYQVKSSCELYTLINNLDIANCYKKILTFETVIYRPTFNEKDFREYVSMLESTEIREIVKEPLIQAAIRNSIVKY